MHGTEIIHAHHPLEHAQVEHFIDPRPHPEARIVHEHVDSAECLERASDKPLTLRRFGDVRGHSDHSPVLGTAGRDRGSPAAGRHAFQFVRTSGGQYEPGAECGQPQGDVLTDTA